jgi:hypothetical protein
VPSTVWPYSAISRRHRLADASASTGPIASQAALVLVWPSIAAEQTKDVKCSLSLRPFVVRQDGYDPSNQPECGVTRMPDDGDSRSQADNRCSMRRER